MNKILTGAGGGGSNPTIVKDSIRSQDSIEFVMGVCEGPVAGLIEGPKSFYVGDTPLQSPTGRNNFEAFELHTYLGSDNASEVKTAFGGTASNVQVGVTAAQYVPITRSTPASLRGQIDRLEVRLVFDQLLKTNSDGDQLEATAEFKLRWRKTTGTDTSWKSFTGSDFGGVELKLETDVMRVEKSPHGGDLTSDKHLGKLPVSGNLGEEDDLNATYTLVGGVVDTSVAGYDRRVDTAYGDFYWKTGTMDYKFVPDETAISAIANPTTVTIAFNGSGAGYISLTAKIHITVWQTGYMKLTGKTGSAYVKEYVRRLPADGYDGDYEIQVERLTTDTDENLFVNFVWESFQCVTLTNKLKYDNLVLVRGLGASSNQFSSLPQFSGIWAGKLVKIPVNYDPVTRVYTGTWNGTFKLGYTDNPAWCLYDMLMDENYGARKHYPKLTADRFSFYEAAQWCDVLVPRIGATGYQPRFTYHDLIDQPREGLGACQYIASIFGGILTTDLNGNVRIKLDKPGSPVQIFGPESVTVEGFQYQFADMASRANDMLVTFVNPELDWAQDVREVKVDSYIDQNGRIPMDFVAVGCIDPFEAQRRAYARLLAANTEVTTVTFSTTRQGILLEPYDIIGITDPYMNWGLSGRIKSLGRDGVSIGLPSTFSDRANWSNSVVGNPRNNLATLWVSTTDSDGSDIVRVTAPIASNANIAPKQSFASTDGRKYRVRVVMRHNGAFAGGSEAAGRLSWRNVSADGTTNTTISTSTLTFSAPNTWQTFDLTVTDQASYINLTPVLYILSTSFGTAGPSIDVKSFTVEDVTDEIHLRDPLYLTGGATYTLTMQSKSGPVDVTVQNVGGTYSKKLLVTSGTLPAGVPANAQFALTSGTIGLVKPFRVLTISESEGKSDLYTITAIEINENKYTDADNMTLSDLVQYSFENSMFPARPSKVQANSGTTHLYLNGDGRVMSRIHVTWEQDPTSFATEFEVFYRRLDADLFQKIKVTGQECYIDNVKDGAVYEIYVKAVNVLNRRSPATNILQHTVVGKLAPPSTPTDLVVVQDGSDVRLDWTGIADLDLSYYEIREGGTNWDNATKIGTSKTDLFVHHNVKDGTLTYRIKAVDTSGNYSNGTLSDSFSVAPPQAFGVTAAISGPNYVITITPNPTDVVPIKEYVIKLGGNEVFRGAATSFRARVDWTGSATKTFTVTAINTAGVQSTPVTATLSITKPGAVNPTGVFGNTGVVLTWSVPDTGTLPVDYYFIQRQDDGSTIDNNIRATTYKIPVDWIGSRTFTVWAVDTAGNVGTKTSVTMISVGASIENAQSKMLRSQQTISWTGIAGSLPIKQYHIYRGDLYADASFMVFGLPGEFGDTPDNQRLATVNAQNWSTLVDWNGTRAFYIIAEDMNGNLSDPVQVFETIAAPPAPVLTHRIVDRNIRLDWEPVVSELRLQEYHVLVDDVLVQKVSGTAATIPIDFAGTVAVQVYAVDEAGNVGASGTRNITVAAPSSFTVTASIVGENLKLSWTTPTATLALSHYIVTRGDTDTFVAKLSANSYTMKADWVGSETFKVTAYDIAGNPSPVQTDSMTITAPAAPSVRPEVLDNNILLRWTNGASTLPTVATEIRKGPTFATAEVLQQVDATFAAFFEFQSGVYTYWAVGIDSAGNYGTPVSQQVRVSEPPDFVLQKNYFSTLNGTRTLVTLNDGVLYFGVSPTATYEQHFTAEGYTSPQSQITAGYPYFLQPTTLSTSKYVETFDYGTTLSSSVITITPTSTVIAGNPTLNCDIEYSANGTTWTMNSGVTQVYAQNFRYVRFTLTVVANSRDDLLAVSSINLRLNTKLKNDSGSGNALSTDATGTVVTFGTSFIDVQSISVTPKTTTATIAVYDFVDAPYPTQFSVYLFDKNGNRVSGPFSWTARGF